MEPKFQNSFIPKKPMGVSQDPGVGAVHSTNIFSTIAAIIFVGTLLFSIGLFAYGKILNGQISKADKAIIEAREAYDPEKIKELIEIDNKITSANNLLRGHIAVSRVLVLFEDLTLKKMRFNSFEYLKKGNSSSVVISGDIQTYNALAEQQEVFLKNQFISNSRFTDFNLGDNGYISVKFSADIDPGLISYKKTIDSMISN